MKRFASVVDDDLLAIEVCVTERRGDVDDGFVVEVFIDLIKRNKINYNMFEGRLSFSDYLSYLQLAKNILKGQTDES